MALKYTHELLAAAAHVSSSYDDVVRWFGSTPTPGNRRYVQAKLHEAGISTAHFTPQGVRHTEARLRELVACSQSVAEVVRRLGISPVGGNQAHIGRRLAELRIDTSHFTASGRPRRKAPRPNRLVLGSPTDGRTGGERLRRALLRQGAAERCAMCRTGTEWNGRPLRLEVDHRNGEWWDNRPENLRLLCPNCHAVTDTYRGRKRQRK
ncbi:HNH endonuclease [Streptomyces sp. YGL11-2]|uniref:HNH endonuclease n=1 Tax=Streptomyces sp. YGL11-2 TaxID=3414028 RepID=UPI003CF2AA55